MQPIKRWYRLRRHWLITLTQEQCHAGMIPLRIIRPMLQGRFSSSCMIIVLYQNTSHTQLRIDRNEITKSTSSFINWFPQLTVNYIKIWIECGGGLQEFINDHTTPFMFLIYLILPNEPAHEIMALFVLRKLILQTRMRSNPVPLDVWFFGTIRLLSYVMCANSEGSGETARMRRLAWAFAGRLCDKYHSLMSWLINVYFNFTFMWHM